MAKRNEEMWETAERKRWENSVVTPATTEKNRLFKLSTETLNRRFAELRVGGLTEEKTVERMVGEGFDRFDLKMCDAVDLDLDDLRLYYID